MRIWAEQSPFEQRSLATVQLRIKRGRHLDSNYSRRNMFRNALDLSKDIL